MNIRLTMCANLMFEIEDRNPNCIHCTLSFVWSERTVASGRQCLVTKFTSGGKRRRFNLKETCTKFVSFNGFLRKKFRPLKLFLLSEHFPNLLFLFGLGIVLFSFDVRKKIRQAGSKKATSIIMGQYTVLTNYSAEIFINLFAFLSKPP